LASCLLSDRWQQRVFAVGPREYVWHDVFVAAMQRGEWRDFEEAFVEGLLRARASWPDDREIEAAADAFRYEHDLIASDETIAWLDRVGVTFDAWTHYLVRRLLLARPRGPHACIAETSIADADFAAEGMCSGTFDQFLRTLAGRAAIAALDLDADVDADPRDITDRATHLAQIESTFQARIGAASTASALASQLARHRFEWTRVDLERMSFESADAAREAACCVREDGLTLSEVAIESRQPVRDTRDLLERLEPELRHAVLGADVDELVGSLEVGSRHEVAWVVGKRPGDLADPIVRARAEEAVVDQMVARAIRTHVRWAPGVSAA
jgi:hypothetical protein